MFPETHEIVERFLVALFSLLILATALIAPGYFFGWVGAVGSVIFLIALSFALDDI